MQIPQKLIEILADGQFHSGESLGKVLNVSRAAIWKQIQQLEGLGLRLESVRGVGYRIPGGLDLLDSGSILGEVSESVRNQLGNFEIHASVDSTNRLAREAAESAASCGAVFLAEHQAAGRGRRGNTWVSPFGASISLSLVWDFDRGAQSLEGLSLAIGIGVRRALLESGLANIALKWPNDIYVSERKLGGILLEITGDPAGECSVIVGVGINVRMPEHREPGIDQPWTDLHRELPELPSRNQIVSSLLEELIPIVSTYQREGFAPYRQEWMSADLFRNRQVSLIHQKTRVSGVVHGVGENGALLLRLPSGEVRSFIGGEISVRSQS